MLPNCHAVITVFAYRGMDGSLQFGSRTARASSSVKLARKESKQTATRIAGVCYAVGWEDLMEQAAGE